MISILKQHLFPVTAYFDRSLVLAFAVPKAQLQPLIPECLSLDTYQDRWAFIAVALVWTKGLRPEGFPKVLGNDFFLAGYRIFVNYTNNAGKRLRGLYIIRSETDKKRMAFLGNLFTAYRYTTTDIAQTTTGNQTIITSRQSGFEVAVDRPKGEVPLPDGSPFPDWKAARRFAGPLPYTFTCNPVNKTVLIIEGVRQNWTPAPLKVENYCFAFIDQMQLRGAVLANAFEVRNVPYYWKKGRVEKWD